MSSIEQYTRVDPAEAPATRLTRLRRRWPLAAALGLVLLLSACFYVPTSVRVVTGTPPPVDVSAMQAALKEYDAAYYTVAASCNGFFGGCVTDWYASFKAPTPSELVAGTPYRVIYYGKNEGAGYQFISVWNWRTSSWFALDEWRVVATDNVMVYKALPEPNTDWVSPQGIAFVDVRTEGNFTHSDANHLAVDAETPPQ